METCPFTLRSPCVRRNHSQVSRAQLQCNCTEQAVRSPLYAGIAPSLQKSLMSVSGARVMHDTTAHAAGAISEKGHFEWQLVGVEGVNGDGKHDHERLRVTPFDFEDVRALAEKRGDGVAFLVDDRYLAAGAPHVTYGEAVAALVAVNLKPGGALGFLALPDVDFALPAHSDRHVRGAAQRGYDLVVGRVLDAHVLARRQNLGLELIDLSPIIVVELAAVMKAAVVALDLENRLGEEAGLNVEVLAGEGEEALADEEA